MRTLAISIEQLSEAAYNAASGELTVRVIQPGMSKNKRFYPAEVLKRDGKIFEGAKMFADHQTESEQKNRPEGSVNNWVASLKNVWAEADGTLKGKAVVIDPAFKAKLNTLAEKNLLHEMGVSIRAVGSASKREIDGVEATYVENLLACRSVDFVTYAGAGGLVEAMEADATRNEGTDVDLIDEAQLRARRPDLIEAIESSAKQGELMKTLEQQLKEAQDALTAEQTKSAGLQTQLDESKKTAAKATASAELTKLLNESKLPEPAKERIRKQFAEAEKTDGMKEAIEAEEAYVKSVGGTAVTTRKNMGSGDNNQEESDKDKKPNLVEAYKLIGMSEIEAKLAAGQ